MKQLVHIAGLQARRGAQFTLAIPDLAVDTGQILCIAGPNGSGKTTLIDCLAGLLRPDAGDVTIAGKKLDQNLKATKRRLGYVPDDEAWLIKELCAKEYFELLAHVYRSAGAKNNLAGRTAELAKRLYFTNFLQPLEQLSHGNKKKVQLIAGLMHGPQVIIVDELRNGLDPLAVIAAERLLREEKARGACIIAATHDLWWAERMADHMLLLVDGAVACRGKTKNLVARYGSIEKLFLAAVNGGEHATV